MILFVLLALTAPISLNGQTTGRVEGYVRDADTGEPLAGVRVGIEGFRLGNITNGDGYYFIPHVPVGLQDITTRLTGYRSVTVRGQRIYAGQTHSIDFELKPTVIGTDGPASFHPLPDLEIEGDASPLMVEDQMASKARITSGTVQALPVDSYRDIVTLQAGVERYGDAMDPEYMMSGRGRTGSGGRRKTSSMWRSGSATTVR